jgi:hypothetical protein
MFDRYITMYREQDDDEASAFEKLLGLMCERLVRARDPTVSR